jgi:hypothetical protein
VCSQPHLRSHVINAFTGSFSLCASVLCFILCYPKAAVRSEAVCQLRGQRGPSGETMRTIAADPEHLRARIGITAVLHNWG